VQCFINFFFWIRGNLIPRKRHFVGSGEGVKPRLSQTLTRDARPDSNSRPAVQISNLLPSRYISWGLHCYLCQAILQMPISSLVVHSNGNHFEVLNYFIVIKLDSALQIDLKLGSNQVNKIIFKS
jgi:hypothetical protein